MTEQMKRNGVEEQLTENQRAVQAKLCSSQSKDEICSFRIGIPKVQ